jgi:hypothetical protein
MLLSMSIRTLFTAHPNSVDESYTRHLAMASGFGLRLIVAGLACLVHGIFPFLCTRTGSDAIRELHTRMVTHRQRPVPPQGATFGAE